MRHKKISGLPTVILGESPDEYEWTLNPATMTRGARLAALKAAKAEKKRREDTGPDYRARQAVRVLKEVVADLFRD